MQARMSGLVAALALAVVVCGALPFAASAGLGPGACCICLGCATPPETQCFELSADQCEAQCSTLDCAEFISTGIGCPQQPPCARFEPPAPAPALAPAGLGLALLAAAAVARRALRA